jgi:tRNA-specific 2-thiouridylase
LHPDLRRGRRGRVTAAKRRRGRAYTRAVDAEAFAEHLRYPRGRGHAPAGSFRGTAGGAACGDLVRIDLRVEHDRVVDAGFDAAGCGAATASGSAAVALVRGTPVLDAARVGAAAIADELGGLSPGKVHAAELAADALHVALGAAVAADGALPSDENRTLVAMSGGVDSAVAALRVRQGGREAVAVTLELWRDAAGDAEASCCSAHAVRVARSVAHGMGLPHFTLDLRDAFRAGVVEPFLADHAAGLTPNPCVRCNGGVRLDAMVAFADRLGAADLATGHYARLTPDGLLRAAVDPAKDQSYMLAALAPETLARLRFPLGDLTKPEVRAVAREAGLPVADKRESQDLCFLAGTGKAAFLARHGGVRDRPGAIVDVAGRELGRHRGAHHFTVGQRKGLGVAAAEPLYVLATDVGANSVTVGPKDALAARTVAVRDAVLHRPGTEVDRVKLRYRSRPLPCRVVEHADGRLTVALDEAADGPAPGQLACLLRGDVVVGHGVIAG